MTSIEVSPTAIRGVDAEMQRLQAENEILRETLTHYANKDNWQDDGFGADEVWRGNCDDGWEFAQAALNLVAAATDEE